MCLCYCFYYRSNRCKDPGHRSWLGWQRTCDLLHRLRKLGRGFQFKPQQRWTNNTKEPRSGVRSSPLHELYTCCYSNGSWESSTVWQCNICTDGRQRQWIHASVHSPQPLSADSRRYCRGYHAMARDSNRQGFWSWWIGHVSAFVVLCDSTRQNSRIIPANNSSTSRLLYNLE